MQVPAANAFHLQFALAGGNYTFTDTAGYLFSTPTGTGAASITGSGTSTITIPSTAATSIVVTLGTGTNLFTFTGSAGTAIAPMTVNTGTVAGDLVSFTGPVTVTGALSLTTGGSITETGTGTIIGGTGVLTTSSGTGTTLGGANAVGTITATNATSGNISLTNTVATLLVNGLTEQAAGTATINNTGGRRSPQCPQRGIWPDRHQFRVSPLSLRAIGGVRRRCAKCLPLPAA